MRHSVLIFEELILETTKRRRNSFKLFSKHI